MTILIILKILALNNDTRNYLIISGRETNYCKNFFVNLSDSIMQYD